MRLRYTDRARDDIELAFSWYERQRRGLGFDFKLTMIEIGILVFHPSVARIGAIYYSIISTSIKAFP